MVKKTFLLILFICCLVDGKAQTYTWKGGHSTLFSDSLNWTPNTWKPMSPTGSETILIQPGTTYNPVFYIGSSTLHYGYFNTCSQSQFTNKGVIYVWNNDSINGDVLLDAYSEFNIRNNAYIGNKSTGNVNLKGTLTTKYDLYVGKGANGNGKLTINSGTLNVGRSLYIGDSGAAGVIVINGVGAINIPGNLVTSMQSLITAGKLITTDTGVELEAVYSNSTTTVQLKRDVSGLYTEYSNYVVLNNGIVSAKIEKSSGKILSLIYKGHEMISQCGTHVTAYYDWTDGSNFEALSHCDFSVTQQNDSLVDLSFKRMYSPEVGDQIGGDMDVHYVIKSGLSGLYTYSELEHKPSYPAVGLGSWRLVYSLGHDDQNYVCEKLYVDSVRHWQMPSFSDTYQSTGIPEIVKMTSGVRSGLYDGKYEYSTELSNLGTWGFASDVNHVGTWMVFGSHEFFNGGPTYHDLNCAASIIHVCLNGLHYNLNGFTVNQGEDWKKIYGPFLIYFNNKDTGDESWFDAQQRAQQETKLWPYEWLKNNTEYPLADARGAVKGNFKVSDPFKPEVTGKKAWVGVTQISNSYNQWQQEGRNYQYWVRTDSLGNFTIPNVRPGTYTLFAFTDGEVGEYSKAGVVVTVKDTLNLGNLEWTIARDKGRLAWEIGYPNRSASEFAHGHTDYMAGYVYNSFYQEFANPIEYDVSKKNWDTALPYAHCSLADASGNLSAWRWHLNFTLPSDISTIGNATLTIAYAGSDHAQQWIYVNNDNSLFVHYYPDNAGGNAMLRQSNHATYSVSTISIPMSRLVKGSNTITLLMPSTSYIGNHIMYDYISLETPYNTTGIADVNNSTILGVSSSPSGDSFTINCSGKVNYEIVSLSGAVMERGIADGKSTIGENLPSGMFLIKASQGGEKKCFKILKNKTR